MLKRLLVLSIGLFLLTSPLPAYAASFVPFGGQIIAITKCPFNPKASLVVIRGVTVTELVYQKGVSFSYREEPPLHQGQWLLGIYATSLGGVSCPVPGAHIAGLILFHGSSK